MSDFEIKQESQGVTFDKVMGRITWVLAGGVAAIAAIGLASYVYQGQLNRDAREKNSPLVAEFNGHSFMITGPDTVSEITTGDNYKTESVVAYDFARGVAIYGPKSPAPGAVFGFGQLPREITDGIRRSVCQATLQAADMGARTEVSTGHFVLNHCQPH